MEIVWIRDGLTSLGNGYGRKEEKKLISFVFFMFVVFRVACGGG